MASPFPEALKGFFAQDGFEGDTAPLRRYLHLAVDEGVVEAGAGGVLGTRPEIHPGWPSPINRPQAHRTRLAGSVEVAIGQLE